STALSARYGVGNTPDGGVVSGGITSPLTGRSERTRAHGPVLLRRGCSLATSPRSRARSPAPRPATNSRELPQGQDQIVVGNRILQPGAPFVEWAPDQIAAVSAE